MTVGIDIGRSGVKISIPAGRLPVFPALACPARVIEEPGEALLAARQTVEHEGQRWFWGETAAIHGGVNPAHDPDFEGSAPYAVLMAAAVQQVLRDLGDALLQLGLGVPAEAGQGVRRAVERCAVRLLPKVKMRVVAQPAAVLAAAAAHDPQLLQQTVALVDVGRYSTDVAVSVQGRPVAGSLFSLPGVRIAVDDLLVRVKGQLVGTPSFEQLEQALQTGVLRHRLSEQSVDSPAYHARLRLQAVVEEAIRRVQLLRPDVQVLILAGGGVELLDRKRLPPHRIAPGGRYAVADGLARLAAAL